jgi:hypothetical protein
MPLLDGRHVDLEYIIGGGRYPWRLGDLRLDAADAETYLANRCGMRREAVADVVRLARIDAAHAAAKTITVTHIWWATYYINDRPVLGWERAKRLLMSEYRRTEAEAEHLLDTAPKRHRETTPAA